MKYLSTFDIIHVISALRGRADHYVRMQSVVPDRYDHYQKEYVRTAELVRFFEDIRDRVYRSDNLSARINVKLN